MAPSSQVLNIADSVICSPPPSFTPGCVHAMMHITLTMPLVLLNSPVAVGGQMPCRPILPCFHASRVSQEMRSTLCLSALHCRICEIGMITCFKHLKVKP